MVLIRVLLLLPILPLLFLVEVTRCDFQSTEKGRNITIRKESVDHLGVIRRRVARIKRSWVPSTIHHLSKRSTTKKADDLFLHSVACYCDAFKTDPEITKYFSRRAEKQPLKFRDVTGYTRFKPSMTGSDDRPKMFPLQVMAQRDKKSVWFLFDVVHSESIIVSRVDFLQFKKTLVRMPEDSCQKIVSKARFEVEGQCKNKNKCDINNEATFKMFSSTNQDFVITLTTKTLFSDPSFVNHNRNTKTIHREQIKIPSFNLVSHTNGVISFPQEEEFDIDFTIRIVNPSDIFIYLYLWDWRHENMLNSWVNILKVDNGFLPPSKFEYENTGDADNAEQLFKVKTVNITELSGYFSAAVSIKITLKSGFEKHSGRLTLTCQTPSPIANERIITSVAAQHTFWIKLPERKRALPRYLIYFHPKTLFLCDENGNKEPRGSTIGSNCTIQCQAFGKDISSIYITKLGPNRARLRSESYVLPNHAIATVDTGVASPNMEGDFRCTVVDTQGQTKMKLIKLYTRLNKIKEFTGYTSHNTNTRYISCTIQGRENTDISISLISKGRAELIETRLDTLAIFQKNLTENNNEKTLTLAIQPSRPEGLYDQRSSYRRHYSTNNTLRCKAKGVPLSVSKDLHLHPYQVLNLGIAPYIDYPPTVRQSIKENGNYTCKVSCQIYGLQPMKVSMLGKLEGQEEAVPMNETSEEVFTTTNYMDGKVVLTTHNIPKDLLGSYRSMSCTADNMFGIDTIVFHAFHLVLKED